MFRFFALLLLLSLTMSLSWAQDETERSVAWLMQADGRLLLMYEDGAEVDRRWEPKEGSEGFFDSLAVTEAWIVFPDFRVRAYVIGGEVTTVTGWSTATGEEVPASLLPDPPKSLAALLVFPADFRGDVGTEKSEEADIEAIIAEEMAALGLGSDVLSEVQDEGALPGDRVATERQSKVTERLERAVKGGYSLDSSKQKNSVPPIISTTRNLYVEYSHDYSYSSDEVERSFAGRGSLGTTFNEMSVEYNVGRPSAALDQLSGGLTANFEGEKTDDPLASDTLNWGLNGKTTKGIGKDTELSADLSLDSINYLASTTTSYDSRELNGSLGVSYFGKNVEYGASLFIDNMTYSDDPAGDYSDFGIELSALGQKGKVDWEIAYTGSSRGYDDVLSESVQTGTTNDDYDSSELSITAEWSFSDSLSTEFSINWSDQSYDNPNETNFDFSTFEFGPDVDWDIGSGWSSTVSLHWSRERYKDRDGDDYDTSPAIQENIDDLNNRDLELSFMYSQKELDLSFGTNWSRDHYPTSNQTVNDENVDSRSRTMNFSLLWRYAADWSFEFNASRSDETYEARSEDNTRADSLSVSLNRKF